MPSIRQLGAGRGARYQLFLDGYRIFRCYDCFRIAAVQDGRAKP